MATTGKTVATKGEILKLRVATEEKRLFCERAAFQGKTLSEWARLTLLGACKMKDVAVMAPPSSARAQAELGKKPTALQQQRRVASHIDHDKIDAFQRKTGMASGGKR